MIEKGNKMKSGIAHVLAFAIAPILTFPLQMILSLVTGPLLSSLGLGYSFTTLRYGLSWCLGSIATVWIGSLVFRLFGLTPTVLMVILIGIGILMTDLRALKHPPIQGIAASQYVRLFASLLGVVIGAFIVKVI